MNCIKNKNFVIYAEKKLVVVVVVVMKTIIKFEITVITQENIEVLHIISVTSDIKHLKKFLQYCKMDQTIIIILL